MQPRVWSNYDDKRLFRQNYVTLNFYTYKENVLRVINRFSYWPLLYDLRSYIANVHPSLILLEQEKSKSKQEHKQIM